MTDWIPFYNSREGSGALDKYTLDNAFLFLTRKRRLFGILDGDYHFISCHGAIYILGIDVYAFAPASLVLGYDKSISSPVYFYFTNNVIETGRVPQLVALSDQHHFIS